MEYNATADVSDVDSRKRIKVDSIESGKLFIPDHLSEALSRSFVVKSSSDGSRSHSNNLFEGLRTLCVRNLPEHTDPEDLKSLFTRSSTAALESILSTGVLTATKQVVTNVQVVQDPESHKCTGYAFVEFADHNIAAETLATLSGPNLLFPGSNRVLTLEWASFAPSLSSVLSKYHFYIGNLRPGLSDRSVLRVLQSIHSGVTSVRLLPQELLGQAPDYVRAGACSSARVEAAHGEVACTSSSFYCVRTGYKLSESLDFDTRTPHDESWSTTAEAKRWSCGFVRLDESCVDKWKSVLLTLRNGLNSSTGKVLRRDPFTLEAAVTPDDRVHASVAIILRPMFGRFNDTKKQLLSTSRLGAPDAKQPYENLEHRTTIFVGNLNEDEKDENLAALFSPFGIIMSLRVAYVKRVAFIELCDHRCALAALCHLRGAVFRHNKLQLDWGRCRPSLRSVPNQTGGGASVTQSSAVLKEKAYTTQLLQAMQPQISTTDVETSPPPSTESDDQRRLWLASLYMSLPVSATDAELLHESSTKTSE